MSFKSILDEVENNLKKILDELSNNELSFSVEPAKSGFGDVSSNISFLLAKQIKKNPKDIASMLSEKYSEEQIRDIIDDISARVRKIELPKFQPHYHVELLLMANP